jgi:lipoate synthase
VTRDDLPDGGAARFAKVLLSESKVEVLIIDFLVNTKFIDIVLNMKLDVFLHNLEIVSISLMPYVAK